jgi:hypothetical protein
MATTCTRCENSGFLNIAHLPDEIVELDANEILEWINAHSSEYPDVTVCDCCGNSEGWYGVPGEHYNSDDPPGHDGPYAYNGGLCECH